MTPGCGRSARRCGSTATGGGGIYINTSTGSITGVTISGNDASAIGGGLFEDSSLDATLNAAEIAKIFGNFAPTDPNISPLRRAMREPTA